MILILLKFREKEKKNKINFNNQNLVNEVVNIIIDLSEHHSTIGTAIDISN